MKGLLKLLPKSWTADIVKDEKVIEKQMVQQEEDYDPSDLSVNLAYKTRWIWYHTILAILIGFTDILLIAIIIILSIKL